jgi:putative acetyltransferase
MISIRRETPNDIPAIRQVNELAFEGKAEAELVDALRESGEPLISMVAEADGQVVGHILFSPVTIQSEAESYEAAGLGPMAVLPGWQGQGVGSKLVQRGLEECRGVGYQSVIVLGHPWFYPRFGFRPSVEWGIRWEHEAPEEAFMALELVPGALEGLAGVARYLPQFEGV